MALEKIFQHLSFRKGEGRSNFLKIHYIHIVCNVGMFFDWYKDYVGMSRTIEWRRYKKWLICRRSMVVLN